jgi:iron complex outermembrane receptor protein
MLDWNRGPWGGTLAQNFQDGYAEVDLLSCADITLPTTRDNCPADRHVPSYSIVDLQGRYTGFRNLSLTLGIRNLFDRAPPLTNQQRSFQVGTDPGYADPRGRMWYGAVRYSFK